MRVLAVGAHPDDVELLCAGSLAHYAAQGAELTIAILTNGALGSTAHSPERTASIRRAESEHAACVLGAELIWLGKPDGFLFDDSATRTDMVDVLRKARPHVVFTHHSRDYHPDHRATGQLVNAARLLAREPALVTAHTPLDCVPALFFMDTFMSVGAPAPDLWVDVTSTFSMKEAMLREHVSQNERRRSNGKPDFLATMRQQAATRGSEVDVEYAEAFYLSHSHPPSTIADLSAPTEQIGLPTVTTRASDVAHE